MKQKNSRSRKSNISGNIKKNSKQNKSISLLLLGIVSSIIVVGMLYSTNVAAKVVNQTEKRYTSVVVSKGDTIWEISDQYYSEEFSSKSNHINEILELNNMSAGEDLKAGAHIVIPYYSN